MYNLINQESRLIHRIKHAIISEPVGISSLSVHIYVYINVHVRYIEQMS